MTNKPLPMATLGLLLGTLAVCLSSCGDPKSEANQGHGPEENSVSQQEALAFFSDLSGRLEIELTEPPEKFAPNMANLVAPETARIRSVVLEVEVWEDGDSRALTEEEWTWIVFREPRIRLSGGARAVVPHDAPNGEHFAVRDVVRAVEETERRTRGDSVWLGGIDIHHVFFEGLQEGEGGVWSIAWGSLTPTPRPDSSHRRRGRRSAPSAEMVDLLRFCAS